MEQGIVRYGKVIVMDRYHGHHRTSVTVQPIQQIQPNLNGFSFKENYLNLLLIKTLIHGTT
jgi:hypothetical protein